MNQTEFQNLLRTELASTQAKNPAYSIRAFAKKLGMGSGSLSQVLAGKRALTLKTITLILDRLGVDPIERAKILKKPKSAVSFKHTLLQADQHFVLSEWYYLAILNLVRTQNFESTAEHISERLGISSNLAKKAVERLERLQLLKRENGKLIRTQTALSTSDGVASSAVKKSHFLNLEIARKALEEQSLEERDFTWLTFAFEPEQMKAAKQKIREFQDEFGEQFSTSKKATEVYRMSMQLFKLTQTTQKTKKTGDLT